MDKGEIDVESNASCSFVRNDHHNDDYSNYDGEKARKMQRMWSTYLDAEQDSSQSSHSTHTVTHPYGAWHGHPVSENRIATSLPPTTSSAHLTPPPRPCCPLIGKECTPCGVNECCATQHRACTGSFHSL